MRPTLTFADIVPGCGYYQGGVRDGYLRGGAKSGGLVSTDDLFGARSQMCSCDPHPGLSTYRQKYSSSSRPMEADANWRSLVNMAAALDTDADLAKPRYFTRAVHDGDRKSVV